MTMQFGDGGSQKLPKPALKRVPITASFPQVQAFARLINGNP